MYPPHMTCILLLICQVLNFVIFPHMNYDLPFLGLDLVTLPGGHLIAIDMQVMCC
jgi:hypothetical protein